MAGARHNLVEKRLNKYGAIKTRLDGITFDSKAEAKRYADLRNMERAGEIANLEVHKRYDLKIGTFKICAYVADFDYDVCLTGDHVTEDCKGVKTSVYRLKAKLMKAIHGIEIVEVKA